jgi:hypothetical protein
MARAFAGGTDRLHTTASYSNVQTEGCVAFWMKTSQVTANAIPVELCRIGATASQNGVLFILNGPANKISFYMKNGGADSASGASVTSVNDGNWHHVAFNWMNGTGTNHSQNFSFSNCSHHSMGDSADAFWASYVGQLAELGVWRGKRRADEIAALAKGISPLRISPNVLDLYVPMTRGTSNRFALAVDTVVGGSVADHPRIIGGLP